MLLLNFSHNVVFFFRLNVSELFKHMLFELSKYTTLQVGKDQEKAQSEKDSHSKTEVGKKQTNNQVLIP